MADLEELVSVLKAAGEITRLRLLALLAEGEMSVKDLTEILEQSQPRVSRHLKLLADAGLVLRHTEGAWVYYRLSEAGPGSELAEWLCPAGNRRAATLDGDLRRLKTVRRARQAQADSYFAKIASNWDALRNLHVAEADVESAIVAMIGQDKIHTLIDVGTGTGRMLELLAGHYDRGIGLDSSREMLAIARAKLERANLGDTIVRQIDISAPQLDAGLPKGDMVILHQVLHYFADPGNALADTRRLLAPGGRMIIVDFAPHKLEFLRDAHEHRRLGLSTKQIRDWSASAAMELVDECVLPNLAEPDGLTVCIWKLQDNNGGAGTGNAH